MIEVPRIIYPTIRSYMRTPPKCRKYDNEPSVSKQTRYMWLISRTIPHGRYRKYVDSFEDAGARPLDERDGLKTLLADVEPGDLVLTWSVYHLSRCSPHDLADVMRTLIIWRQAHVIAAFQVGRKRLELDSQSGALFIAGLEVADYLARDPHRYRPPKPKSKPPTGS